MSVMPSTGAGPTSPEVQRDERARVVHVPTPPKSSSTVYIYPGLLSAARRHALMLDCQCPARIYTCLQCQVVAEESNQNLTGDSGRAFEESCTHEISCPICIEIFHAHDLVRVLPCSSGHIFHSRCILTWFSSGNRCPLCNEVVGDVSLSTEAASGVGRRTGAATEYSGGASNSGGFDENPRAPFHIQEMSTPVGPASRVQNSSILSNHHRRNTFSAGVPPIARRGFPVELTQSRTRRLPLTGGFRLQCSVADEQMRRQQVLSRSANETWRPRSPDEASSERPEVYGSRAYSYIAHDSVRMNIERTL